MYADHRGTATAPECCYHTKLSIKNISHCRLWSVITFPMEIQCVQCTKSHHAEMPAYKHFGQTTRGRNRASDRSESPAARSGCHSMMHQLRSGSGSGGSGGSGGGIAMSHNKRKRRGHDGRVRVEWKKGRSLRFLKRKGK